MPPVPESPGMQNPNPLTALESVRLGENTLEEAIHFIYQRGAGVVGAEFFPAIVRDFGSVLGADHAFIGVHTETGHSVETVALWADGEIVDNITYELEGTPCAEVMGKDVCVYEQKVADLFPDDQLLDDMGIEGYVGIPLHDPKGSSLGIVVALYRRRVPDSKSTAALMLVFATRISAELQRAQQEEKARRLEAQMLRTQKLESLGVLAGGLAHDFNNLLSSIMGSAELALLESPPRGPVSERLEFIRDTAVGAGELCRQLLAYAGRGRFEILNWDLSRVVQEQEKLLRSSISKNAALQLSLANDLPGIQVDVTQVRQLLLNLVVNASEAIGNSSGVIRVTTGERHCDADDLQSAYVASCDPGHFVFLEVSDDGAGMTEEVREKLFDPFFTTKFTGRGLGLAAILGIVKGYGGSIQVYSELESGSAFRVLLPASQAPLTENVKKIESAPWKGSGLAMLVDDDEAVSIVGRQMLKAIGFEAITARCHA